jgi:hypothetical protein
MGIQFEGKAILRRKKAIPFSQLDDELLAIDSQAGYCYALNETSGRIWDLMETPIDFDGLCSQLQREYVVDKDTCVREVTGFLEDLRKAGLVEIDDAPVR